jgi:hypothetical protein
MTLANTGDLSRDVGKFIMGCQSGAVVRSMFKINISAACHLLRSWVRFPVIPIPQGFQIKPAGSPSTRVICAVYFHLVFNKKKKIYFFFGENDPPDSFSPL